MLRGRFGHSLGFRSSLLVISAVSTTLTAQIAQEAYLKASNTEGGTSPLFLGDAFGRSVAVSGNTVLVGAPQEDSASTGVNQDQANNGVRDAGAAYVFVRNALGQWTQQAYLKASNPGGDWFGFAVAVSGDTAVVGAFRKDNSAGAAYIFVRDQTGNWAQQAYLKASNIGENDGFGYSVAISGDTMVVGAPWESGGATGVNGNQNDNNAPQSGAVYVFARNGATWTQQAYLKASNTGTADIFGYSVAIAGDTIVVGAIQEGSGATGVNGNQNDNSVSFSGAAYVFERKRASWSQQAYLKPFNTRENQSFGASVGVSADTVVVGGYGEDELSGGAHIFVRDGTNWNQQAHLKASNAGQVDVFGASVAISGDTVVVGALGEDSNTTGVDGNQANNSATDSGAAYVFVRNAGTWTQRAYLKASNTGPLYDDNFGRSVAISGSTVIVGAHQEDSNSVGVNGNQTDNSAINSGAAYIFTAPAPPQCDGFCITSFYVQPISVTITWRSQPGKTYYIGFKAALTDPHWTPVSGGIVAQGTQASWTGLRERGTASAFYCVVMLD